MYIPQNTLEDCLLNLFLPSKYLTAALVDTPAGGRYRYIADEFDDISRLQNLLLFLFMFLAIMLIDWRSTDSTQIHTVISVYIHVSEGYNINI